METLVIIPTYNEDPLHSVVDDILHNTTCAVLLVDDGSKEPLNFAQNKRVYTATHDTNLGQGAALQTGFDIAKLLDPEQVITMDGDGQHKVADISVLVDTLKSTMSDIVFGSRNIGETDSSAPWIRRVLIQLGIVFNWLYTGLKMTDAHNGFRVLNRKAYSKIYLSEPEMAHATEILEQVAKHNLVYAECPVSISYTEYSKGKGQRNINSVSIIKNLIVRRL